MAERDKADSHRGREELSETRGSAAPDRAENALERVETSTDVGQEQGDQPTAEPPVDVSERDDATQPVEDAPTGGVDVAGDSEPDNPTAPA